MGDAADLGYMVMLHVVLIPEDLSVACVANRVEVLPVDRRRRRGSLARDGQREMVVGSYASMHDLEEAVVLEPGLSESVE